MLRADEAGFGIEVDCRMLGRCHVSTGMGQVGIQLPAIDHWEAEGWLAYLRGRPGSGGARITSPTLKGEDGLTQVVCMVDWLTEIGTEVDQTCDLRVWVDTQSLRSVAVVRILRVVEMLCLGVLTLTGNPDGQTGRDASSGGRSAQLAEAVSRPDDPSGTISRLMFGPFAGTLDSTRIVALILSVVGMTTGIANGHLPPSVPADAQGQLRTIVREYMLGYRIVPSTADEPSDLRDVIRHILTRTPVAV